MENKNCFLEIDFDRLPCQTNIYGVTKIAPTATNPSSKLLVALANGKIYMCDHQEHSSNIQKGSKEVPFTYIPPKCHVISIDSFNCGARGLIIGVTFAEESGENFLNIYCNYGDNVPEFHERDLENLAYTFKSFALTFTPFQLTHRKVKRCNDDSSRSVFILLGDDKFHVYSQISDDVEFIEDEIKDYFVELVVCESVPTYLEIYAVDQTTRVTAVGYANGKICLFLVDCTTNTIIKSWKIQHSSIISQLVLYPDNRNQKDEYANFMLVVASTREEAVVYSDVLNLGFEKPVILRSSGDGDCVTCCAVGRDNCDGTIEIVIGTYDQRILLYKNFSTPIVEPSWVKHFAHPVLKTELCDITGDYITELIVFTTKGIHILQRNLHNVLNVYKNVLKNEIIDAKKD
uniref:KICSTOR complex protein kaptin n=1 Tax=Ciona intestinalis TaxID=7719 RepID=UPI000180B5D7|nr:KICSTOR complex protein kaptin [Ciona intestinalis]|eukprot:XP_002130530.1 KICSTOR complex protein kaptin [Ciona intestinalis]